MKLLQKIALLYGCLAAAIVCAQQTDSLAKLLKTPLHDTERCFILNELVELSGDDEWPAYNESLYKLTESKLKTLSAKDPLKNTYLKYYAAALNNRGYLAKQQGNVLLALDLFEKSLHLQEQLKDTAGIVTTLSNVGDIHDSQGNPQKAMDYFKRGLILSEKSDYKSGIALCFNNIGFLYKQAGDLDKALMYYQKSLALHQQEGNIIDVTSCFNNIAGIQFRKKEFEKALESYRFCLKEYETSGDMEGVALSLNNIGTVFIKLNNFAEAEKFCLQSLQIAKENHLQEDVCNAAETLSDICEHKKDAKAALYYYELFISTRDSLNNEATRKAAIKSELKYEYEKKAAEDSVRISKERVVAATLIEARKNLFWYMAAGFILVLGGLFFAIKRYRYSIRQKRIIELQKNLVEEKQKEILDSIHYAERIQKALMSSERYVEKHLKLLQKKL